MILPEFLSTEFFSFIGLFLITFSFLPQTIQTIKTGKTEAINLSMYILYPTGSACMFVYGYKAENLSIMIWETVAVILSVTITAIKIKNRIVHGEK